MLWNRGELWLCWHFCMGKLENIQNQIMSIRFCINLLFRALYAIVICTKYEISNSLQVFEMNFDERFLWCGMIRGNFSEKIWKLCSKKAKFKSYLYLLLKFRLKKSIICKLNATHHKTVKTYLAFYINHYFRNTIGYHNIFFT